MPLLIVVLGKYAYMRQIIGSIDTMTPREISEPYTRIQEAVRNEHAGILEGSARSPSGVECTNPHGLPILVCNVAEI